MGPVFEEERMFGMLGMGVMMGATYVYKTSFLQMSWRKTILIAIVSVNVLDAIPQFLAAFDVRVLFS